jgi:fumarate hydratase class II
MTVTTANEFRIEEDALGEVHVPTEHLWGAQTQRSHMNFPIGVERFRWGRPVIRALGILKKCAALANGQLGQLTREKVDLIVRAAQEVIDGRLDAEFPLVVFRYADQHEYQRSDRQPLDSAYRRRNWVKETNSSQR